MTLATNHPYDLIPITNTVADYFSNQPNVVRGGPFSLRMLQASRSGLQCTFVDSEDAPEWSRRIARYARDRLRDNVRCQWRAEDAIAADLRGQGKGQRAVHFQHAMKLDPRIHQGSQQYSNCEAWTVREICGDCIAVDLLERNELHQYEGRPGTAFVYSNRHTRGDSGMTLGDGAAAVHEIGFGAEKSYLDGKYDLSTQSKDEAAGVRWGGSGLPSDLREVVKDNLIEQVSTVQDEEAVKDLLFGGHFINTGSTRTAGGPGDPVSPMGPVGGHAQALIGYDDTDEFRAWYRQTTGKTLTDWVAIFDQSWGPDWLNVTNWPEKLWGPRPEGAFVLKGRDAMQLVTMWGEALAFCRVKGFPLRKLPDWASGQYL